VAVPGTTQLTRTLLVACVTRAAGVVDQDLHGAQGLGPLKDRVNTRGVAHVSADWLRAAAFGNDARGDPMGCLRVDIDNDDAGAQRGETHGNDLTYTTAGARHDRDGPIDVYRDPEVITAPYALLNA